MRINFQDCFFRAKIKLLLTHPLSFLCQKGRLNGLIRGLLYKDLSALFDLTPNAPGNAPGRGRKSPAWKSPVLCGLVLFAGVIGMSMTFVSPRAYGQSEFPENPMDLYRSVASQCVGHWEDQPCVNNISKTVLYMGTEYAARLLRNGKRDSVENLRQHCAAATAAAEQDVPSYAIISALTSCVNIIVEIRDNTNLAPDKNAYQLLVGAVLCLNNHSSCASIEEQLSRF